MAISAPVEKRIFGFSFRKMKKILRIPKIKLKGLFAKFIIT
jgi:hypothetical protein